MQSRQYDRHEKRKDRDRSADRARSRDHYSRPDDVRSSRHRRDQRDEARHQGRWQKERVGSRSPRRGDRLTSKKGTYKFDGGKETGMSSQVQRHDRDRPATPKISKVGSDHELDAQRPIDGQTDAKAESSDQMMAMLGFGGFGSTKEKKVSGNNSGGVYREQRPVKYRQYMNRVGGFNRPLES